MTAAVKLRARSTVNLAHYPPGVSWGPRTMTDYELVWLLSGSATWTVALGGGQQPVCTVLTPGTIALSRAGMAESYAWSPDQHSTHAWVHFSLVEETAAGGTTDWPLTRHLRDADLLPGLCSYLVALGECDEPGAAERSEEVLGLLVDVLVRGPLPRPGVSVRSPVVRAALDHVRQHWSSGRADIVPLTRLASAAGVSVGHLSREFRAEFGTGLSGTLELIRLAIAATTLQRTTMTLGAVAELAGFADAYHLSRRFSRAYGVPPGRYRRAGVDADPLAPITTFGLAPVWSATVGWSSLGAETGPCGTADRGAST
jgi:AraC-like DNA-binding protein